jgi:hypothetical protein
MVSSGQPANTPAEGAVARGVTQVVHYTSQRGIMGSLRKGSVLSRERVANDPDLAYIFEGVWDRKDPDWIDYISLSISRTNLDLFRRSRKNHPDWWWGVLSFDPAVLDHEGVWFTTTNNIYPPCLRGQGREGFDAMFAERVPFGYYGSEHWRRSDHPGELTTDPAAEVLYRGALSLEHLRTIYVPAKEQRRMVHAWCETFECDEPPVEVDPSVFA